MNKILVIALGGTIGSTKGNSISLDKNNLKILDYIARSDVEFETASPFSVLSENMTIAHFNKLLAFLSDVDFKKYLGVIILHGSDTLAFTSSVIANAFPNENIVFVASDKPVEDETANGIDNFNNAVDLLVLGTNGVYVSYNEIFKANQVTSIGVEEKLISINVAPSPTNCTKINDNNILIVNSYVGFNPNNYNLENIDAVLIGMYHSATAPKEAVDFASNAPVPVFFATHRASADYETAQGIKNIIFNSTIENAYAMLLSYDFNKGV